MTTAVDDDWCRVYDTSNHYWHDIRFYVQTVTHGGWMDFIVYQACSWADENNPLLTRKGDGNTHDVPASEAAEKAERFASGSIKWDSCCNMKFDAQEDVMLHFCGKRETTNIGVLMERLYDLAAKTMPRWDATLAD